jgi:3-deoxy-D-arabino-heptulosonate 7-phosphate (DAHP) synthase
MIEVHLDPKNAASDGPQCLDEENFRRAMAKIRPFVQLAEKSME